MQLRFDSSAFLVLQDWCEHNQTIIDDPETHPALQSHFVKYEALVPKLAGIFHVADCGGISPSEMISADACNRAVKYVEYLRTHANRIYGMGVQPEMANAQTILTRFNRLNDEFTLRDIRRKSWVGLNNPQDIEHALKVLIDHGYLKQESKSSGRATFFYIKHPDYALTKLTKPSEA